MQICSMATLFSDEYFMQAAFKEAEKAFDMGEIPVGAVIVANDTIVAKAHNLTEKLCDVTAHAEIQAITSASEHLGGKYLHDCTLYVTLEPCVMCAGALYWSQIGKVVFATSDDKRGASCVSPSLYHPKTLVTRGVMEVACREIIQAFFQSKRDK